MLTRALKEQNLQGIELIDSAVPFEDKNDGNPDIADVANLQP